MPITVKRKHNRESTTSTSDLKLPARPAKPRSISPSAKATSTSTKLIRPDSLTGLSKLPREAASSKPAPSPASFTTFLTTTTDSSDQHAFRALPGFQWQRNAHGLIDCFADCDKKSYGYGGFKKRRNFLVHLREIHGQDIGSHDRRGARGWKGTQRKQTMKDIGEMAEGSGVDAGARTGEDTDYGIESDGLLEPPIQFWIKRDSREKVETKECPILNTEKEAVLEEDAPADIEDEEIEYGYQDWPEDEIQFDPYHLSHFDLFGVWLERKMGTQLDWWPLRPPVHPDASGLTRMSWECKCGSTLSSVIPNDTVGSYQRPQSSYGGSSGRGGLGIYPIKKPGPPRSPPQPTAAPPPPAGAHVRTKPPPQSPATPPPSNDPGRPQTAKRPQTPPRQSPSERLVCPPSPPNTPPMQQDTELPEPTLPGRLSLGIATYILCCFRKGWYRTVLIHLGGGTFKNDQEFFRNLRDEYRRVRGWWHWCSLSVVVQIRFVRFTQYYLDFVDCHESGVLPPPDNSDYDYHPKPPRNPPTLPATELMHYFDSPECAGTATYCLDLLPKRVVGRLERGARAEGWGLQPGEGMSLWRLLVLLLAVWISSMVFAVWWLVGRGDLQGAFVPAGYAVALVAVGVVLPEMRVVWVK